MSVMTNLEARWLYSMRSINTRLIGAVALLRAICKDCCALDELKCMLAKLNNQFKQPTTSHLSNEGLEYARK